MQAKRSLLLDCVSLNKQERTGKGFLYVGTYRPPYLLAACGGATGMLTPN